MSTLDRPVDLVDLAAAAFSSYQDGDSSRMPEFVERVTPVLWHIARGQSLSRTTAEDVVQQAWLRLIEQAERISDPRGVLKWLMTTTRREAWRLAQRTSRENSVQDIPEPPPALMESVSDHVHNTEEHALLWTHVGKLSERCQYLLRVIAFSEKPDYAAIAASLGMPVGSIGPTRGRCLASLRAALIADPAFDYGGSR
ncbi:MAG: sigma-70 family RNA polymerase sigma factor [Ancrocorticia sp.]